MLDYNDILLWDLYIMTLSIGLASCWLSAKKKSLTDHVKDVILFTVTDGAQLTKKKSNNFQKKTKDKMVRASGYRLTSV